jgi:murein L,D-transpeptidase YafK
MTDYQMEEIYGLVEEAFKGGQEKIQLAAFPFRMTTQNLARYAYDPNAPFWAMLKSGDDAFSATGRPPSVAVCNQRYVFNLKGADDLDANAPCPPGAATYVANVRRSPAKLAASLWPYPR